MSLKPNAPSWSSDQPSTNRSLTRLNSAGAADNLNMEQRPLPALRWNERLGMKYQVNGTMVVSCWCEVEADSPEEARRLASKLEVADHHIDGSFPVDECWHFDSDGTPDISSVDDA